MSDTATLETPIETSESLELESIQQESPLALINGERLSAMPTDLYIPPDALEIILETFEGPFDLLLYLIKQQNLDILDIPIAEVTRQYMVYVQWMKGLRLELAAEYLVMAAWLAEIKSRMLLPRPAELEAEEDPRAELVRRLQVYEQIREAAIALEAMPQQGRDVFCATIEPPELSQTRPLPQLVLTDLLSAFANAMKRADLSVHHAVMREPLSIRERMTQILARLVDVPGAEFKDLFFISEGRAGVVVAFIAILELIKQTLIELTQDESFGPIYIRAVTT